LLVTRRLGSQSLSYIYFPQKDGRRCVQVCARLRGFAGKVVSRKATRLPISVDWDVEPTTCQVRQLSLLGAGDLSLGPKKDSDIQKLLQRTS
jgi:hypothetical protein